MVSSSIGMVRLERSFLGVAPRGAFVGGDEALVDPQGALLRVEVVPAQSEDFAASQPVEDSHPECDRPSMLSGDREEPVDLHSSPDHRLLLPHGLGDRAREPDTGGRGAREESLVDCFGELGSQDGTTDLNTALGQLPSGGEVVDPTGDVVAIERRQRDRAEPVLDVRDRPRVLLLCLLGDVGA